MRLARILTAVALLACATSATRLETVFSVTMPYSETPGGAVVVGDALYAICGPFGTVLEAVNLTTRMNMWTSPNFTTTFGAIDVFVATNQAILIGFGDVIVALSTATGQQLWSQNGYQLQQPPAAFSYGNTIYAQVVLPTAFDALQAFDVATGTPGYFQYGNTLVVDGNTAFAAQYSLNGGMIVNEVLRAIDISSNTTLWVVPFSPPQILAPVVNSEYVAFSNLSGSDEIAVVLHRKNGSVVQAFQAFNGFASLGVSSFAGNKLFALIGVDYPRYVLADLTTGYIVWTRSAAEVGYGGILCGDALVSISQSLVLTIAPIGSSSSVSIPQVPALAYPAIVDFGSGLVQVWNLQGYTFWDINTGNFVGSNEQAPSGAVSMPLTWNGLSILVSGNIVSALKVTK